MCVYRHLFYKNARVFFIFKLELIHGKSQSAEYSRACVTKKIKKKFMRQKRLFADFLILTFCFVEAASSMWTIKWISVRRRKSNKFLEFKSTIISMNALKCASFSAKGKKMWTVQEKLHRQIGYTLHFEKIRRKIVYNILTMKNASFYLHIVLAFSLKINSSTSFIIMFFIFIFFFHPQRNIHIWGLLVFWKDSISMGKILGYLLQLPTCCKSLKQHSFHLNRISVCVSNTLPFEQFFYDITNFQTITNCQANSKWWKTTRKNDCEHEVIGYAFRWQSFIS